MANPQPDDSTGQGGNPISPALVAAREIRAIGGWHTPVDGKRAYLDDWPDLRMEPDEDPELVNGRATGAGIILGASGHADLEADCLAAELVFRKLAPPTGRIWRHRELAHRLYRSDAAHEEWELPVSLRQTPEERLALAEVRAGNHQSVVPPSVHPDGTPYVWLKREQPETAAAEALHRVGMLGAIAGALAWIWGVGMREKMTLAVSGFLRRRGIAEAEALVVVEAICAAASPQDAEVETRIGAVRDTYAKPDGAAFTGLPTLADCVGEPLAGWLGKQFPAASFAEPDAARFSATAERGPSQATLLARFADGLKLFHTGGGDAEPYARARVGDHYEVLRVRSKAFRLFLCGQFYREKGSALASEPLEQGLRTIEARALFDGPAIPVHQRVARGPDGEIYLDLANPGWQAVGITAAGWRVVDNPPVYFCRTRGTLALPHPTRGGTADDLFRFVHVGNDRDRNDRTRKLVLGFELMALNPAGPHPVLCIHGPQGSGKSFSAGRLRATVDPAKPLLRSAPREVGDVVVAASNGWVCAWNNLSHLSSELSDAFCCLSTGEGFGKRQLFTDAEEWAFEGHRPVIFNGITELATRGDLIDRAEILYLPQFGPEERYDERTLLVEFEEARPGILGALCDAASRALSDLPSTHLANPPRMADYATFVTAAEGAFGWDPGEFRRAYDENRAEANDLALEASLIFQPLRELADGSSAEEHWEGTATELLQALAAKVGEQATKRKGWPGSAKVLSGELRRLQTNLREAGVGIEFLRSGDRANAKLIRVWNMPANKRPQRPPASDEHKTSDAIGAGLDATAGISDASDEADRVETDASGAANADFSACADCATEPPTLFPPGENAKQYAQEAGL
jgi:hypothetical protein